MRRIISFRRLFDTVNYSYTKTLIQSGVALLLKNVFTRVKVAFWIFGLINNVSYVVILSAAIDLVGSATPKGLVLLADVFPSFLVKLIAPYYIHKVPYSTRIVIMCSLSTSGMFTIALASSELVGTKLFGVILASLSSGLGEMSILGLTHFYGPSSLAAWSSGTGGAGIIGSGLYVILTSTLKMSVGNSLLLSAILPIVMPLTFYFVLPRDLLLKTIRRDYNVVTQVPVDDEDISAYWSDDDSQRHAIGHDTVNSPLDEQISNDFKSTLQRTRAIFIPYMLPLLIVYAAEYTINQGITPTLLFPLAGTYFSDFRSFYPTYAFLYQMGVFISRSSLPFLTLESLLTASILQVLNLLLVTLQSLYFFLPSVTILFIIMLWEGLLGGIVYVNTFAAIMREKRGQEREWSLGAATVSDSAGILIAGIIGIIIEPRLCEWNVRNGRPWCREVGRT